MDFRTFYKMNMLLVVDITGMLLCRSVKIVELHSYGLIRISQVIRDILSTT